MWKDWIHLRALMWVTGLFYNWLLAQNQPPQCDIPEICPCPGWFGFTGPLLHLPESTSLKNPGPSVHKATGLRTWEPDSVSDELCGLEQIIVLSGPHFYSSAKVKYLFWKVSTISSSTASLHNLMLFWNPRIPLKWFHMNAIIMSTNTVKYIFEILYIYSAIARKSI